MYKSPIDIFVADVQKQFVQRHDDQIYQVVMNLGINVDKAELIRALQYDREQYDRGFADGYQNAKDEVVHGYWEKHGKHDWRCSACKVGVPYSFTGHHYCHACGATMDEERKDNE